MKSDYKSDRTESCELIQEIYNNTVKYFSKNINLV